MLTDYLLLIFRFLFHPLVFSNNAFVYFISFASANVWPFIDHFSCFFYLAPFLNPHCISDQEANSLATPNTFSGSNTGLFIVLEILSA